MSTVPRIRVICPLYPSYDLYVQCIPSMSCYVLLCPLYGIRLHFISGNKTREFNIPKSQHNSEPEVSACHFQNDISLQSAWKRMWLYLVFSTSQVQISGRRQASLITVSHDFLLFTQSSILENATPRGASSDVRGDVLPPLWDFGNE
jgi:hypothetical protein